MKKQSNPKKNKTSLCEKSIGLGECSTRKSYHPLFQEKLKYLEDAKKKAEESENKFRALFENIADGVLVADIETKKFKLGNNMICEMLGYTQEELMRLGVRDIHPQEQLPHVLEQFEKIARKEISMPTNIPVKRKEGGIFYVDINATFLTLSGKEYLLGVFRDVTRRKQAEEDLRFANIIMKTQQETSLDGILVVDEEGKMISFNQRFIDMWGIPADVAESKSDERALQSVLDRLVYPAEFLARVEYLYAHRSEKSCDEIDLIDSVTFERYSAPMFGADGKYYGRVWYFRDITGRKRAEEVLREKEKELEIKAHNLEEANIALKVLLKRMDKDKTELEEKVLLNIKELVAPYLEKLKMTGLDEKQKTYVSILESNINQVISPFAHRLSSKFLNLTSTEIQIANLLKQDKTSKEISKLLNSSPRTIAFHRENIRKKLGLNNRKTNLKSYLLSLN
jgi:PAS domain S-box-containing protein